MEGRVVIKREALGINLGFKDGKNVKVIPNEIFPLVIMTTMANFDVLRILIDEGN